jgi:hypothetical protein
MRPKFYSSLRYTKEIPSLETYPCDYVSVGDDDASGEGREAGGAAGVVKKCCLTLGLAFVPPGYFYSGSLLPSPMSCESDL